MVRNKLKEIRMKEYMLNQKEFAEKLDIAQGQFNRYEKELAVPTLEVALKIAYKLNKDVKDIFCLVE